MSKPDRQRSSEAELGEIVIDLWAKYGRDGTMDDFVREAKQAILDAIKRAKPDEVEPGLIWGENVARGYNKSIGLYERNLMKELLGE